MVESKVSALKYFEFFTFHRISRIEYPHDRATLKNVDGSQARYFRAVDVALFIIFIRQPLDRSR